MPRLFAVDFDGRESQGIYRLERVYDGEAEKFLPEILSGISAEISVIRTSEIAALVVKDTELAGDLGDLSDALASLRTGEIAALRTDADALAAGLADLEDVKLAAVSQSLNNLRAAFDLFLTGDANGGDIDRLAELVAAIAANRGSIDALVAAKANQADLAALANRVVPLEKTATQSANGLMSAADKQKLDGIAANATNTANPPAAATEAPKAHGTAAVGTSAKFAREDHVHPSNNTDTHWTSHLYAGTATGNANAATGNDATYLILCDNTTVRNRVKLKGSGSVTVGSDAAGNITITGTDTNTTYADMTGASATANGAHGLVPAPAAGAANRYLRSDGTWQVPPDTNTDTHWASHLYAGASNGNANAATTNGNTYLIICDNTTARDRRLIKGTGSVTVTSDANGAITINGTDTNTTYGDATQSAAGLLSAADKKKLDGIGNPNTFATGPLEIYHATPFIDFHFGKSTADYTARIIELAQGVLSLNASPPDDATANQIATCAWIFAHCLALTGGTLTGQLVIKNNLGLLLRSTSDVKAARPSATIHTYAEIQDKNNARIGALIRSHYADGKVETRIQTTDEKGNNHNMGIQADANGVASGFCPTAPATAEDTEIVTAAWALAKFLKLAGGTMTGRLTIQYAGNGLILKHPDDVAASATTAQRWTYLEMLDKNNARIASLVHGHATSGLTNTYIECKGQNSAMATLGVQVDASGVQSGYCPNPPAADSSNKIATTSWAIPKAQNRGTPAGHETAQVLTNSQTIGINSSDCINLATSGAVTLTFTAGAATVRAVKVICLTASAATTLAISGAVWANNGSAPVWGNAGKILVLLAHFVGGRVVLSVLDNTQ